MSKTIEPLEFPAKCPQCGFNTVIEGKNYRVMKVSDTQLICHLCGGFTTEDDVREAMKR